MISILRCPACSRDGEWELDVAERDEREVREGTLRCTSCGSRHRIHRGVVDLLHAPPDFVVREAEGLRRFAERMRADGWTRDRVLELPYVDLGYWCPQALGMEQLLTSPRTQAVLTPGTRILDVGANTCWASAMFAQQGLEVVALDIAVHELQGLYTSDWWFEGKDVFFERVLSVMFAPALASESFDVVFCSQVLHHNSAPDLARTFRELWRILRPGGTVFAINEPVRALRSPKLRPKSGPEAEFEGHEHAYLRSTYTRAARAAGFAVEVVAPRQIGALDDGPWTIAPETTSRAAVRMAVAHAIRRTGAIRSAYLAWKTYVTGVSLNMVATKAASA